MAGRDPLPHLAHVEGAQEERHAADVIRVRVGEHEAADDGHPVAPEVGPEDGLPHVEARVERPAGVHHPGAAGGRAHHDRVTLPDVEEGRRAGGRLSVRGPQPATRHSVPAPQRTRPRRRPRANAASPAMDTAAGPSAGVATRTSSQGSGAHHLAGEKERVREPPRPASRRRAPRNGTSAEAPRIAKPASSTAPLSGTATRFRRRAAGARRWKCSASSGPSAACAPSEEARASSARHGHDGRRATIGGVRRTRPRVATNESWKPTSPTDEGRWARRPRAARPRRFAASPSRSSVRPEDEDHRHHRRAQHGHVAADEGAVEDEGQRRRPSRAATGEAPTHVRAQPRSAATIATCAPESAST